MPEGPLGLFINETRGGHQPAVADLRRDGAPGQDLLALPAGLVLVTGDDQRPDQAVRALAQPGTGTGEFGDQRRIPARGRAGERVPGGVVDVRRPRTDDPRARGGGQARQPGVGQHDLRAEAAGRVGARGAGDPGAHDDQPHRTPPLRVCSLASRCTSRPWSGRAGENTHSTWVGPAVGGTWKVCGALDWKVKASPAPSVNVSPTTTIRS